ncbi:MAG: response regulator, partial [Woeseia sp.]
MRLLVIEDDQTLRETLCGQLAASGFGIEQAADGKEGLYFALEYPIDLAIVDLGLPELPGLDLIRKVREEGKTFPILILTARDRWQDKVDGLDAGADDYVVKPFQFEEV